MHFLRSDLKLALRTLGQTPWVTAVALATLALGMGANTAIFSVIRGVIFDPLSAPDADRLVMMRELTPERPFLGMSYESFRDYEQQSSSFAALAVVRPQSVNVTGGGERPERIRGLFVSASFFDVLESPLLGRPIAAGEDIVGGARTAVLSHGFWQRRFGGDEDVLEQTILLNNEPHTIVGVMGPKFRFPLDTTEAFISAQTYPGGLLRDSQSFFGIARLTGSVTLATASAEVALIAARLAETYPEVQEGRSARVDPLTEMLVGGRSQQLFGILAAAVGMVLLIAGANVTNLQLIRATGRRREMAIRAALGGDRGRLVRQQLTESLVLALGGGLLSLVLAQGGVELMRRFGPGWIQGRYSIALDVKALFFVTFLVLLTGVFVGLVPALRASRTRLTEVLQEGGRTDPAAGHHRLRGALVVVQTALAVALLIGAALLVRSFDELQRVEVGFDSDNLLTIQLRLPNNKYVEDEEVITFFDRMLETVAAVPGVQGVASAQGMPFAGDEGTFELLADGVDPGSDVEVPRVGANTVSANFFKVLGIPLVAGRPFDTRDRLDGNAVAIVSQRVVDEFWPGENGIGRTFRNRGDETVYSIVGIVGDIHSRGLRDGANPMAYIPYSQDPTHFATLAVRVPSDAMSFAPAVRDAIWSIDADQPVWEVMSQNERIAGWIGSERFATSLLTLFSAIALLLAAIGLAGVIAYSVGQRTREIGVRMALGADRSDILRWILRQGLLLLVAGLGLGLAAAAALSRVLAGVLFGVGHFDLVAFTVAPAFLALTALAACYLPARRATSIDPARALHDG